MEFKEDLDEEMILSEDILDLDEYDIETGGKLISDMEKIDIEERKLPDIEVKEMVIRETGNFLNLKENVINIPIEMIVFPFFTPQKQNKRVNFKYSFQDLGVTMYCTLVSKDNEDMVFQPSIFEEKIYTYLISMYEKKRDINDTDEYIEFEISDFICGFLGNKMNRNYYSKVEQSLKNLKNTEYQFVVSNHSKLGKYKFEDEEFKLLTYKKLKIGKKVLYRVTLNKNIRQKIKDKRYIKYNSKNLLEILDKDVIASRIYKYISKIRYNKVEDEASIRALAAIIPLKTEQIVSRINTNGENRKYRLNRIKQVLKRIDKAFQVLSKLGYIEKYRIIEKGGEHFVKYKFNLEKDNECHISSYLEKNNLQVEHKGKWDKVNEAKKLRAEAKKNEIQEAVIIDSEENPTLNFDKAIKKAKRNIYVSKYWSKRVENKLKRVVEEFGEEFAIDLLNRIYKKLNTDIKTTLVQYMNGIIKNMKTERKAVKKENLQLFKQGSVKVKKPSMPGDSVKRKIKPDQIEKIYNNLDEIQKIEVEQKALELCEKKEGVSVSFLLQLKKKSEAIYMSTIVRFIGEVLEKK